MLCLIYAASWNPPYFVWLANRGWMYFWKVTEDDATK